MYTFTLVYYFRKVVGGLHYIDTQLLSSYMRWAMKIEYKVSNDYVVYSSKRMTDLKLFSVFNFLLIWPPSFDPKGQSKS